MNESDGVRAHPVIAIDGGAGTGKTTSAALVAERLGFCYVDSGAVYRALALALSAAGKLDASDPGFPDAVESIPLRVEPLPDRFRVFLGGKEMGAELRTPEISGLASRLAVHGVVRARVGRLLRGAAGLGPLVVEGRDIGTVVFPDATLKVFLTADLAERARRRHLDLLHQGIDQASDHVAKELAERDRRDSTRSDAPLREADGALCLDTTDCTVEQQVEAILRAYRQVAGELPRESRSGRAPAGDA